MRINAVITEQAVNSKGMADILGKLDIGNLVRAKVLEMTSGELMLKLFDGTVFRAATASEIDTAPGESLELIVKGRKDGTLILETIKKETPFIEGSSNDVIKMLDSLNVKHEAKNLQLAVEIKSAGVNPSKELFDAASGLLDSFKALTPEKAVFLSSRNISVLPQTMDTAIRLIEGNLKLGSQLDDLQAAITKILDGSMPNKEAQSGSQMQNVQAPDTKGTFSNIGNSANRSQSDQPAKNINSTGSMISPDEEGNAADDILGGDLLKIQGKTADARSNRPMDGRQNSAASMSKTSEIIPGGDDFIKALKPELLNIIQRDMENPENTRNDMKELAGKVKEAFKGLFVNTESETLSSELDVKKIYKDILGKLDNIKEISQGLNAADRADITARANNIEDGIKLLNQISTNNVYVQIPLNLSGFNTTGDLYIMKKEKNRKRIDPQNVVMLISLDTQNIGRVDALLDVKGKNVGINLRAEEQKIIDFMKENYVHLYSSLMDKGYKLVDVKYRLLEERANPANVERLAQKELEGGRVSVDLKI